MSEFKLGTETRFFAVSSLPDSVLFHIQDSDTVSSKAFLTEEEVVELIAFLQSITFEVPLA